MQLEQKRIEHLIHYWIMVEEAKQREEQLLARQLAVSTPSYDSYLRTPNYSRDYRD